MKTISTTNQAWLKQYCKDRAVAVADFDSEKLATVLEVFFYLGSICRISSAYSLPAEIKRALYGRDIPKVLGKGAQP